MRAKNPIIRLSLSQTRWMPPWAWWATSPTVSPVKLASWTPLRLAVKMPPGSFGEDGPGLRRWV